MGGDRVLATTETFYECSVCGVPAGPLTSERLMRPHPASPSAGTRGPCRGSLSAPRLVGEPREEDCPECGQSVEVVTSGRFVSHLTDGSRGCGMSDRVVPGLLTEPTHYEQAVEGLSGSLPGGAVPPRRGNGRSRKEDGLGLVAVLLGGLMFLALWLLAKPLLHGQMDWLAYVPFGVAAGVALTRWRPAMGPAIFLLSLLLGFAVGPIQLKRVQLQAEERFAAQVQDVLEGQEGQLTSDEAIRVGWDMCAALHTVKEAPDEAFRGDPAVTVAGFTAEAGGIGSSATEQELDQFTDIVRLAGRHLC